MASSEYVEGRPRFTVGLASHLFIASGENQEVCLCHELLLSGLKIERQKVIPFFYKGIKLDAGYRLDLVVDG